MSISSILIYLFVFTTSVFSTGVVEYIVKNKRVIRKRTKTKACVLLFSSMAVLAPCVLAAVREPSVGYDVKNYLMGNYNFALNSTSFRSYYTNLPFDVEPLFAVITFAFAKINNLGLLFFTIEALIVIPVYVVLYKRRRIGSMTIGMIIFLFFFYNFSLSGMRQSIAMSLLLFAYQLLSEKKKIKAASCVAIAFFFHKSAIVLVAVYFGSYYISKLSRSKQRGIYVCLAVFSVLLFVFYSRIALAFSNLITIVSPRYGFYVRKYLAVYSGHIWSNIPLTDLICKSVILFVFCTVYRPNHRNKSYLNMITMLLLGRYFVLFNANFFESLRLAYYFDYLMVIFVPTVFRYVHDNGNRITLSMMILLPSSLYWLHFIMMIGGYGTNVFAFR